jgi:class 3 adenylate cyclase
MTPLEIAGLITASITIISTIIAVSIRLANYQSEKRIAQLEKVNLELSHKLDMSIDSQNRLIETIRLLKSTGHDAGILKDEIDQELALLSEMVGVENASILIPYPPYNSDQFAFLTLIGDEKNRAKFKNLLIPISSGIAGRVYASGSPETVNNPQSNSDWNASVDKRASFRTKNILCLPLKVGNELVGVVQFLNRANEFSGEDCQIMENPIKTLALKVKRFTQHEENYEALGLGTGNRVPNGTILYTDLSSSSTLLKGAYPLSDNQVINMINQYLERTSEVAMKHGCIIDKFMWDGCIYSLNVVKPVKDQHLVAYRTALNLYNDFCELKASWLNDDLPVDNLFFRIVLTSGPILQVDMGPAQYRQRTIVGDPLVAASALCGSAPRDRSILIVDKLVFDSIKNDHMKYMRMKTTELGKARDLIVEAYIIELP